MNTSNNATDYLVAVARAGTGLVPVIGSVIGELIGAIVPNQRVDRIAKYMQVLGDLMATTEEAQFRARAQGAEFNDLFEDSLHDVARAQTDERIQYIARVMKNALSQDDMDYARYKHLLQLLRELNDVQVIILIGLAVRFTPGEDTFRQTHKDVLFSESPSLGSSQEVVDNHTLHTSYKQQMYRLGLLKPAFTKPRRGAAPELDLDTGMIKANGYRLTSLGRMLAKSIDSLSAEEESEE